MRRQMVTTMYNKYNYLEAIRNSKKILNRLITPIESAAVDVPIVSSLKTVFKLQLSHT